MAKDPKKKAAKPAKSKRPLKRVKAPALFDGAIPDRIPALDKQCEKLMEAQAEISKAREHKDEVHAKVLDMMHEANITRYHHEATGKVFQIDAPEVVKFKNQKNDKPADDGNKINPDGDGETEPLDEDEEVKEKDTESAPA